MSNTITLIIILAIFVLALTASTCQTYVKPCEFYIGLRNYSGTEFAALRIENARADSSAEKSTEWLLTEKQHTGGDLFRFAARDTQGGDAVFRLQLIDQAGTPAADTTLTLELGLEKRITYMLICKADKTLELETLVKPL